MFTTLLTSQHACCEKGPCQSVNKVVKKSMFCPVLGLYMVIYNAFEQILTDFTCILPQTYSHIPVLVNRTSCQSGLSCHSRARSSFSAALSKSIIPIFVLHSRFYLLQKRVTSVSSSITVLANVAKWFWMAPENVGGIIRKHVTIVALTTEAYS